MLEDAQQFLEGDITLDLRDSCREAGGHRLFGDGGGDGG